MPAYWLIIVAGIVAVALVIWSVTVQRGKHRAQKAALEQLGFQPCLNQKGWLEETILRLENNRGFRYEVRDPQRLAGDPAVYYYVKVRQQRDATPITQEEILFPLKQPVKGGLVLTVKPSSLSPGLASRLLGAIATGHWDSQPDDLQRLELPRDLTDTNLVAALATPGSSLYDLLDSRTLSVVQGLGDAGGLLIRFRDGWCSVSSASAQFPFRMGELVARIRPLL